MAEKYTRNDMRRILKQDIGTSALTEQKIRDVQEKSSRPYIGRRLARFMAEKYTRNDMRRILKQDIGTSALTEQKIREA